MVLDTHTQSLISFGLLHAVRRAELRALVSRPRFADGFPAAKLVGRSQRQAKPPNRLDLDEKVYSSTLDWKPMPVREAAVSINSKTQLISLSLQGAGRPLKSIAWGTCYTFPCFDSPGKPRWPTFPCARLTLHSENS